jgi:hypothetical protein
MSYLLIIVLTVSGVHDSHMRGAPDLQSCLSMAEDVKRNMETIQSEWRLSTKCVPILKTTGV